MAVISWYSSDTYGRAYSVRPDLWPAGSAVLIFKPRSDIGHCYAAYYGTDSFTKSLVAMAQVGDEVCGGPGVAEALVLEDRVRPDRGGHQAGGGVSIGGGRTHIVKGSDTWTPVASP